MCVKKARISQCFERECKCAFIIFSAAKMNYNFLPMIDSDTTKVIDVEKYSGSYSYLLKVECGGVNLACSLLYEMFKVRSYNSRK